MLFAAGEASGDLHGAGVAAAIRRLDPARAMSGLGGARMGDAGVELIERTDRQGVMGFLEVLGHLRRHWGLLRAIGERMRSGTVGLFIPIDYPGFNMKAAATARASGVPVLYYITPQVWAWRAGRLRTMAKVITKAAVILPFEEPLLRSHGIDAEFVGHPLLDRATDLPSRDAARVALGLPRDRPVLAVFPGSRAQEIGHHLDDFVATAAELRRRRPELHVVIAGAPTVELEEVRLPFPIARGASLTVLRAADAALCKSGTTTLEAAVAGCPLIVAYRTSAVSYAIARRFVTIGRIALVNVVAGEAVAPEFVQDALRPAAMADALEPLLIAGAPERAAQLAGLARVRGLLGAPGASERVARMALALAR